MYSKRFTFWPHIHPFTHTFTPSGRQLPCKVLPNPLEAIWGSVSCPRTLTCWTVGAGTKLSGSSYSHPNMVSYTVIRFPGWRLLLFLRQMKDTSLWPYDSIFVSSDHKSEDQKSSSLSRGAYGKVKQACVRLIWRIGILLVLRSWDPAVCSVSCTVWLETLPPAEPRFTRMALVVILGFFFFTSLTILLANAGVILGFRPCPLRISTVRNVLYFLTGLLRYHYWDPESLCVNVIQHSHHWDPLYSSSFFWSPTTSAYFVLFQPFSYQNVQMVLGMGAMAFFISNSYTF